MACGDAADRRPGPSARFSCCLFVRGLLRVYPAADPRCLDGCQKTEKYAGRCIEVCPKTGPHAWLNKPQIAAALHIIPPLLQQHQS